MAISGLKRQIVVAISGLTEEANRRGDISTDASAWWETAPLLKRLLDRILLLFGLRRVKKRYSIE